MPYKSINILEYKKFYVFKESHFCCTICRILEQSLEESKIGTKRKRADLWFVDPRNPHERKRVSNWPVGMKNVGNTCWFSAVVQVSSLTVFKFCSECVVYFKNKTIYWLAIFNFDLFFFS